MSLRLSAGFIHAAPWVPLMAAAATLAGLYLLPGGDTLPTRQWSVFLGLIVGLAVGYCIAALTAPRSTARRANSRSYALALQRVASLHARCKELGRGDRVDAALAEAEAQLGLISGRLGNTCGQTRYRAVDPSWSTGSGYQDLWTGIHRAEEALLIAGTTDEFRASITHDLLRFEGSGMAPFIGKELRQIEKDLDEDQGKGAELGPRIRELRRAVNEYRDERWDALIRARLRLMRSALMTAWTSYVLLVLALALQVPRGTVTAGAVFFVVGALIGLVAQVRKDARRDEAVEDYGLMAARLYQTVLASGLAGVGGVLLIPFLVEVVGSTSGGSSAPEPDAFDLSVNPGSLVLAAIFGLSPQILLDRLGDAGDKYKAQLSASAATPPVSDAAGTGG